VTRKMAIGVAAAAIVSAVAIGASARGTDDGGSLPAPNSTVKVPETTYKYECKSRDIRTRWGRAVRRKICAYAKATGTPKPTIECGWRTKQVPTPWGRLLEKVCD
jgi:hypothetical protein